MITNETVTRDNIDNESFYNVVQLCNITGYADPVAALKSTGETVRVTRDNGGNITGGELIRKSGNESARNLFRYIPSHNEYSTVDEAAAGMEKTDTAVEQLVNGKWVHFRTLTAQDHADAAWMQE